MERVLRLFVKDFLNLSVKAVLIWMCVDTLVVIFASVVPNGHVFILAHLLNDSAISLIAGLVSRSHLMEGFFSVLRSRNCLGQKTDESIYLSGVLLILII